MTFDRASRILFFAPHPDDESLAGGGLLQKAIAAGAAVEVIFATNGENNPWPLRVMERQWRIDVTDRALWGLRRMQETLDALTTLGVPRTSAQFLNLPDQRITDLLLRERDAALRQLREIIRRASPTLLVAPALSDLHPDHSALSLLIELALPAAPASMQRLCYAVHTGEQAIETGAPISLSLNAKEQERKRQAVLCHRSQMLLSRRRFLRHVSGCEKFFRVAPARASSPDHAVTFAVVENGSLRVRLRGKNRRASFAKSTLHLLARSGFSRESAARILRMQNGELRDAASDRLITLADVRVGNHEAEVNLPLVEELTSAAQLFVKFTEPTFFFDRSGWREIPVAPQPAEKSSLGLLANGWAKIDELA